MMKLFVLLLLALPALSSESGITGKTCNQNTDNCPGHECQNGGTCVGGVNACNCLCTPEFTGRLCTEDVDECQLMPGACQNGGTCHNTYGSYQCVCVNGWTGYDCGENIDDCAYAACHQGSTCHDRVASFYCECPRGRTGLLCHLDDACISNPCPKGSDCDTNPLNGKHFCSCPRGYVGASCDQDVDECSLDHNPCEHAGNCINTKGSFQCKCQQGYTGPRCEQDINECASNPCMNEATCLNIIGDFHCVCKPGYSGWRCETDINECSSDPCYYGTCIDGLASFSCNCKPGYIGRLCETNINECPSQPYRNGGNCQDRENADIYKATTDLLLDPGLGHKVPNITANRSTNEVLPTPVEIKNKLDLHSLDWYSSLNINQTNLEWQVFNHSLPKGAISIYNKYVGRIDYVCQFLCNAGFYSPNIDPYCHYPYKGKEYTSFLWPFEVLVNKDNFELMEWKDGSYGSVPPNSVKTCSKEVYVGMNEYGLGKVDVNDEVFYLPWVGYEYWYRYYQVLTFNKDIDSEHLSEVKYKTDGVKPIEYPPETMRKSAITNYQCQTVTGTATLSKTYQVEQRWDTSFSITVGVQTSITAGIPKIGSAGIEFSEETTLQFTKGTTYIESTTHTVSVQCKVPPNQSCGVSMVGYKYGAEIPYTARISRTYSNGETRWTSISGTYRGVQMGEILAVMDRCEPVPDPTPCP